MLQPPVFFFLQLCYAIATVAGGAGCSRITHGLTAFLISGAHCECKSVLGGPDPALSSWTGCERTVGGVCGGLPHALGNTCRRISSWQSHPQASVRRLRSKTDDVIAPSATGWNNRPSRRLQPGCSCGEPEWERHPNTFYGGGAGTQIKMGVSFEDCEVGCCDDPADKCIGIGHTCVPGAPCVHPVADQQCMWYQAMGGKLRRNDGLYTGFLHLPSGTKHCKAVPGYAYMHSRAGN